MTSETDGKPYVVDAERPLQKNVRLPQTSQACCQARSGRVTGGGTTGGALLLRRGWLGAGGRHYPPYAGAVANLKLNFRKRAYSDVGNIRRLICPLTLQSRLRSQPQRDMGWLHRLSVHHPLVEPLLHRFSVIVPPLSVKCNAHVSMCRWQFRSHSWIYFGDRFFVYRCIWDEF